MPKTAARLLFRAGLFATFIIVIVAGGNWWWHAKILHAQGPHDAPQIILVAPGDGHATIRWTLERAGVINALYAYDAVRLMAGDSFVPKAGEYEIPARATLSDIVAILDAGKSLQRRITVIEGMRSAQIQQQLNNSELLSGQIDQTPAEGSILPETYFFTRDTPRQDVLARMQQKRDIVLLEYWIDRKPDLPYATPEDAIEAIVGGSGGGGGRAARSDSVVQLRHHRIKIRLRHRLALAASPLPTKPQIQSRDEIDQQGRDNRRVECLKVIWVVTS